MLMVSYLIPYFQKVQIHKLTFKIFFPKKGWDTTLLLFAHGSCVTADKRSKRHSNLGAGIEDGSKMQGQPEKQKATYLRWYFTNITTLGSLGIDDRE